MRLGEGPPAARAAVAPLAPQQVGRPASERQVAHPHHRPLLDLERCPSAVRAAARAGDQLDLEVELVANLDHSLHLEAVKTDEAGSLIRHPLFLLAPRSMTTQSLVRARMS